MDGTGLRRRSVWNPVAALFHLDARELDHPGPLCEVFREDGLEFRSRAAKHGAAELDDPGSDLGIGEPGIELLVQQLDDVSRSAPGHADARKTAGLITRHEVRDRWN